MNPQSMRRRGHWVGLSLMTSTKTLNPLILSRRLVLIREWRPLVEQVDASGQINFGPMYRKGRGVATLHAFLGNYL